VREIGEAALHGAGPDGSTAPSTDEEAETRLGALAGALLLDQQATGAKARTELGWQPTGPTLLGDLTSGSYLGGAPTAG
jgi:hypothetical protein